MSDSRLGATRRKWPLYTLELTPLCEMSDEVPAVIGPILFPEESERPLKSDGYP